jgi:8-amino-7-oxononanoate synthase
MTPAHWARRAGEESDAIREAGRWRWPRDVDGNALGGKLCEDGQSVVSFASNDYLGLSVHPTVVAAAHDALDRWGAGAGAARLIVGSRPVHSALEEALAAWKRVEMAALFSSGFHANLGTLGGLAGPGVVVFSDERNHASIIDGCRLSRAAVHVYRHSDVDHLRHLLSQAPSSDCVVVTDAVFSMDGDVAPLEELAACCASRDALLVLDDAHGVFAPIEPSGLPCEALVVGTLSKTLGALGGFVAGRRSLVELIVNRARPYIFTTALSPADAAAALAAVGIVTSAEGQRLRRRLRRHVDQIAPAHPSAIVPIVLGSEQAALAAAQHLLDQGLLVPAIRPPTVPPGTSRLRVTLSAGHRDADVARLAAALATLARNAP